MRASQDAQRKAYIGDPAGHRAVRMHQLSGEQQVFCRAGPCVGHAPLRGADRGDAAGVGRIAQRSADIVAEADRRHAGRERDRLAAARAARRTTRIPGVAGQPVERAVGVHAQAHVGQVGAADRDCAGSPHPFDDRRVRRRDGIGESRDAPGRRAAGDVDIVLDGERDAVQRPQRFTGSGLAIRLDRIAARLFGENLHDRVDGRVDRLDPTKVCFDDLDAGKSVRAIPAAKSPAERLQSSVMPRASRDRPRGQAGRI